MAKAVELCPAAFCVRRRFRRNYESGRYGGEVRKRRMTPDLTRHRTKYTHKGETGMVGRWEIYLPYGAVS